MAGTTVDEGKTVYRCVQESLAAFGFAYTLKEVIHLIGGMNKREAICLLMNRKNANTKESQVEKVFSHFKQKVEEAYRTDHRIKEKAGATELFRYLKSTGIKVTLDTGYYRSTADILIRKMGWQKEGLIDFSVTSDEVKQGRPAPYKKYAPGITMLILSYIFLTLLRDIRDNFVANIWVEAGYGGHPGIFTSTELPISLAVLVIISLLVLVRNNLRAFLINHWLIMES